MSGDRGRYSKVSRRIWGSASFRALTQPKPCGGWLFFRLLTAPELSNIPGLFQAWDVALAKSLGWQLKDFEKAFEELFREGLAVADWEVGLVWLPKGIEHNTPESPNVVTSWRTAWQELPDCELKDRAEALFKGWMEAKGEAWVKAFAKASGKASGKGSPKTKANQEQEQEQEQKQEQEQEQEHPAATPAPFRFPMSATWVPQPEIVAALKIGGIPDWAVPELVGRVRAHFAANQADYRTDTEWNQALSKWAFRDWASPKKRPTKPEPATSGDLGEYGKSAEWG